MEALKERIVRYVDTYKKENARYNSMLRQLEEQKKIVENLAGKFLGLERDLKLLWKYPPSELPYKLEGKEKRIARAFVKAEETLENLLPFFFQLADEYPEEVHELSTLHASLAMMEGPVLLVGNVWKYAMDAVRKLRKKFLEQREQEMARLKEEKEEKLLDIARRYNKALEQYMEYAHGTAVNFEDSEKRKHVENESHHYVFELGKQLGEWASRKGSRLRPEDLEEFEKELEERLRAKILLAKHKELANVLRVEDEKERARIVQALLQIYGQRILELARHLREPLGKDVIEKLLSSPITPRMRKLLKFLQHLTNNIHFYNKVAALNQETFELLLRTGEKFGLGPLSPKTAERLFELLGDELGYRALSALHRSYFRGLIGTEIESWEDLVKALEVAREKLRGATIIKYAGKEKAQLSKEQARRRLRPLMQSMAAHIYSKLKSGGARILRRDGVWSLVVDIATSSKKMLTRAYQLVSTLRALDYNARVENVNGKRMLVIDGRKEEILRLAAELQSTEVEKYAKKIIKKGRPFVNSLKESVSMAIPMLRSLGRAVASGDVRIDIDEKKHRIVLHVVRETHESTVALDKDFHALLKRIAEDAGIGTEFTIIKRGKKVYIPLDLWVILAQEPELRKKLEELLERYARKRAKEKK